MNPGSAWAILLENPANLWANGTLVIDNQGSMTYKGQMATRTSTGWSVTLPHDGAGCFIAFTVTSVSPQVMGTAQSTCFPGGEDKFNGQQEPATETKAAHQY